MKKALFIATTGGFLSHFEADNAKMLREMGYEIIYSANYSYHTYGISEIPRANDLVKVYQIPIVKEPWRVRENFQAIKWLWRFIENESVDIVLCHNPMGGAIGRLAGLFHREKRPHVIYTAHGFHFYHGAPGKQWLIYGTAEKILARMTDQLLTINKEDFETASRFTLRKNGRVEKISGVGLDRTRFCPRPEIAETVRNELCIPKDAVHFVAASELNKNKNLDRVIQAFARIQAENFYFTVCGSGPEENTLKALIRELNLQNKVRLIGYRTDMEYILQSADWFIASSIREGLGMSALEAMACGVPLVVLDNRGTREYVCDEINSIVCYCNTTEDWCKAFERIQKEPDLRDRLAGNARNSTEMFSTDRTKEQMHRILMYADQCVEMQKEK